MNFNNNLLILFFVFISSCSDDTDIQLFSEECIECIEHQYPQALDDILLMPNSVNYWTNLDQILLDLLTEAGYCQYLELNDTIN